MNRFLKPFREVGLVMYLLARRFSNQMRRSQAEHHAGGTVTFLPSLVLESQRPETNATNGYVPNLLRGSAAVLHSFSLHHSARGRSAPSSE